MDTYYHTIKATGLKFGYIGIPRLKSYVDLYLYYMSKLYTAKGKK